MKENHIDILTIQETHLNEQFAKNISNLFGRRIEMLHSLNLVATNLAKVVFVLNKERTYVNELT